MTPKNSSMAYHPVPAIASNFPQSTASPSVIFPFPGCSAESTRVAREVLTENDHKYDIYEATRFAHNHFPHSLLTRYALGAPPRLLRDIWENDRKHLVSLDPEAEDREATDESKVPEVINRDNWDKPEYLGFDGSYSRYLAFFHQEIDRLGPIETLMEYVFSPRANWEGRQPRMLLHLLAGFFHPFIHVGFGLEFRDRILIAEGLAEACVHKVDFFESLFPPTYPKDILGSNTSQNTPEPAAPKEKTWSPLDLSSASATSDRDTSLTLLELYAKIQTHPELPPIPYNPDSLMRDRMLGAVEGEKGKILWRLMDRWSLNDEELKDGPGGWEVKVGELALLNTLLACGTGREGTELKIDFFLMHALTSSIFLPSYLPLLPIPARRALLKTYALVCIQTALSRGRPDLCPNLIMNRTEFPVAPHTNSTVAQDGQVGSDPSDESTRNAWLSLVESCLYAHDSHVPKSVRSLLYWSTHYSHVPAGGFPGPVDAETGKETVEGMSKVDGTVFVRAAGMIMELTGWVREGEYEAGWDFSALGYDEAWEKS